MFPPTSDLTRHPPTGRRLPRPAGRMTLARTPDPSAMSLDSPTAAPRPADASAGASHEEMVIARLRQLAAQRADAEVLNQVRGRRAILDHLAADDFQIGAAILRQCRLLMPAAADDAADLLATLADRLPPPQKVSGSPVLREYLDAAINLNEGLYRTAHVDRFWEFVDRLLDRELGAVPDLRERLLGFAAEIGLTAKLPQTIEAKLLAYVERPYLFSTPRQFLNVLAYKLHRSILRRDFEVVSGPWLVEWCRYLARSQFSRPRRNADRRSLLEVKNEMHRRIASIFKYGDALRGACGGWRKSLIVLVIKLDYQLFIRNKIANWRLTYPWFALVRSLLRRLGKPTRVRPTDTTTAAEPRTALRVMPPAELAANANDVLVTRAQGGIGDVMMMRPGLLALARLRRQGDVVFATNPGFFSVFGPEDGITLVDIEKIDVDRHAFARWINLTDCPASRVEVRQLPRIRTNRLEIFTRAVGVKFRRHVRGRLPPMGFDKHAEAAAFEILRGAVTAGTRTVGIQLRSAESYRDSPVLLEVARRLSERYRVFVFDNRPIPREPGDRFVAIDNQPFPVVMALAARLNAMITPDSSLLHLAGANRVPTVAIFGPTDGRLRTGDYPTVTFLDARKQLSCVPCWRNEFSKCRLSDTFESICMTMITADDVIEALEKQMAAAAPPESP